MFISAIILVFTFIYSITSIATVFLLNGLIHISQIANKHVAKPQDELKIGQEVDAKITAVDLEQKRVSLSIRALLPEEAVEEAAPVEEEAPAVEEVPAVEEAPAEEAVAEETAE